MLRNQVHNRLFSDHSIKPKFSRDTALFTSLFKINPERFESGVFKAKYFQKVPLNKKPSEEALLLWHLRLSYCKLKYLPHTEKNQFSFQAGTYCSYFMVPISSWGKKNVLKFEYWLNFFFLLQATINVLRFPTAHYLQTKHNHVNSLKQEKRNTKNKHNWYGPDTF